MSNVEDRIIASFRAEGLEPQAWSNAPHAVYEEHQHSFDKVLYCVAGSIVFSTPSGEVALRAGDRLDLPSGTPHRAIVGAEGVTCWEAARR